MRQNRLIHRLLAPALLCTGVTAAAGASAIDQRPDTEEVVDEEKSSEPVAVQRGELVVRESLPYAPTSNTIATKLPLELAATPANVGVVEGALFRHQGGAVLGDALENVSGLNVQTGSGVFDFFVVRGFDSLNSGLVLTDGAPEPEATFYQLYNAERVEVFKGPAGFLYGSNPLAGAVNIVRKQPVPGRFGRVGLELGSFDTFEGALDWNVGAPSHRHAFRLNGLWRDTGGYRDGVEGSATAVNPAWTWRPGEATSVNVNVELLESDYAPDAGLPLLDGAPAPVDRERSYASPLDRSRQDVVRAQVDFETRLTDRIRLRNKLYYRELDWNTNGTLLGPAFPDGFGGFQLVRSLLMLEDRQRFTGDQVEVVVELSRGRVRHDLLAGVEVGSYRDDFDLDVAFLPTIDLFDPVETTMEPLFPIPGQAAAGRTTTEIVAPYVVDQITLSDRLQLMLGLRFDSIDFEDEATGTSRSDGEASPMAGIVYSPRDDLRLYANAARSFAPPSPRVVGEQLPEESRQLEIGARREFLDGRLRSTLALYELERENIAIPDDNGFTQQAGDQRSRGLELDLIGDLRDGWSVVLAYAHTDSELTRFSELVQTAAPPFFEVLDRSGNRSAFSPENLLNAWVVKRFGRLEVAGGLRWVDEQFIAEDNATSIDDYALLDASLAYRFEGWRLRLHLENLTDEGYETRGFGSFSVIPGRPFAASLGLELDL